MGMAFQATPAILDEPMRHEYGLRSKTEARHVRQQIQENLKFSVA
jgi:hypothetical protein